MDRPADYSVLADNRLVAYLWRSETGHLRRAGAKGAEPIVDVAFAEILLFDATRVEVMRKIVAASTEFDALLFKLGLDGFEVRDGEVAPHARRRRF
jgi:hypothetical protein